MPSSSSSKSSCIQFALALCISSQYEEREMLELLFGVTTLLVLLAGVLARFALDAVLAAH